MLEWFYVQEDLKAVQEMRKVENNKIQIFIKENKENITKYITINKEENVENVLNREINFKANE